MPLYLQMRRQDQKLRSKMINKTKHHDGATKQSPPSTDLSTTAGGPRSEHMNVPPFHPQNAHFNTAELPPLKMTKVQDKCISDAMAAIRESVNDRVAKRQKPLECDYHLDDNSLSFEGGNQSLVDKLDASPDLAQVVASPGGLITYRNESFCKLTKQSIRLRKVPLTLFELIDAEYLPQFFGMLALALHNVTAFDSVHLIKNNGDATAANDMMDENNDETPKSSHLSITLPCNKLLRSSSASSYNITVVYMNDFYSVKKCFLGIISQGNDSCNVRSSLTRCHSVVSSSSSNGDLSDMAESNDLKTAMPCGKIVQIDDDTLFTMIKNL